MGHANNFKITVLGSSGALPAYGRFPTCQYLAIQRHHILIDCGEGAQLQLAKYGINIHRIDHIFISHLHGDHYLGLTGLLFSMHLQRRESDLHLYSFPGLDEILLAQLKHARSVLNYRLVFHQIPEESSIVLFEDDSISVTTIPLEHKIPTSGFLFREKNRGHRLDKEKLVAGMAVQHLVTLRKGEDVYGEDGKVRFRSADFTIPPRPPLSYAYCSDTQPSEAVVRQVQGVDLLYHEATFMEDEKAKALETKHSTAAGAALVALQAGVKKLLIGHFSARYKDLGPLLEEARKIFPQTSLASEGTTFDLYSEWS